MCSLKKLINNYFIFVSTVLTEIKILLLIYTCVSLWIIHSLTHFYVSVIFYSLNTILYFSPTSALSYFSLLSLIYTLLKIQYDALYSLKSFLRFRNFYSDSFLVFKDSFYFYFIFHYLGIFFSIIRKIFKFKRLE